MDKEKLIEVFHTTGKPLKFNEITEILSLKTKKDKIKLKRILRKLLRQGKIHITKSQTYCLSNEANLIKGKVEFNPAGFAFLIPEKNIGSDIFLKPGTLLEALNEDIVLVRIDKQKKNGKPEGSIVKILERGLKDVVGIFQKNKDFGFVVPLDKRIIRDFYIPKEKFKNAKNGDVVYIKITRYPTKSHNPVGEIVKVLGKPEKESTLLSTINLKYKIKEKFPNIVKKEAKALLNLEYKKNRRRKDLTSIKFFTIDGKKARDFDDAVAIFKEGENYRLFVSIADVEFYVKENSSIDKEAYTRSTSVYYPDKVYPMLPEILSNDLCSLNPHTNKFSFTVEMLINKNGELIEKDFYKSVINSKFRATYEDIGAILKNEDKNLKKIYSPIINDIEIMLELTEILRNKRFEKGSIDFNLPEVEIEFNNNGKVNNIKKIERNYAHILIEEFMLFANETVANYLSHRNIPLLYRVHDFPDEDKLQEIARFLYHVGININIKSPKDIQKALEKVKNQPYEKLINYLFLRAMKQAIYSSENIGHFALAKENYTHFTSPIRRYPDLVNHRILRRAINKKITTQYIEKLNNKLPDIASYTSERERMAADAEREVIEWKKIEFMEDKFNIPFEGTITGVTSFGIFVEINDILVEGMIPLRNLTDDYYSFIEKDYMVRGKRRGNFYRLGDQVRVKLDRIDKINRKIDFILLEKINDYK